jgi:hypothetical protein
MAKLWAAIAVLLVAGMAHDALAQNIIKERRQAKAGETCATKYGECGGWCDKNRPGANHAYCAKECVTYRDFCERSGIWSTAAGSVETIGLRSK